MIVVDGVHKRYQTEHGAGKWVLQDVSFVIPPNVNVGLVGANGAGKSTLLRLIGGVDHPTKGRVERHCRVSWPMGFGGGLQGMLTGRQNAKFVCRIHGHQEDISDRLAYIREFAEIGDAFDEPVKTYSSGMQARLKFAISLAFDFDVYISDELTAVGDAAFRQKAKTAFGQLVDRAGLIMVSHHEGTLKEFCSAGIWLHEGRTYWFDDIEDALAAYREKQGIVDSKGAGEVRSEVRSALYHLNQQRKSLGMLQKGLLGHPMIVEPKMAERLVEHAEKIGMQLVPEKRIAEYSCRLIDGAIPVFCQNTSDPTAAPEGFYELKSQCVKVEIDK